MKKYKFNYAIIIQLISIVLGGSCTNDVSKSTTNLEKNHIGEIKSEVNVSNDSIQLISKLYKGLEILPFMKGSEFSYSFEYKEEEREVTVKSVGMVGGYKVEYFIVLNDPDEIYSRNGFFAYDDSYKYVKSYFKIDGLMVELTNLYLSNLSHELVKPALLWYGDGFGISSKFYKIKGKEFFLIRGIDLYCNGNHCTSYELFVLQKKENELSSDVFFFPGLYPYDFENTFLFDKNNDNNPEFFTTKLTDELKGIEDFETYTLYFDKTSKYQHK